MTKKLIQALEPRMMLDGAAVAPALDTIDDLAKLKCTSFKVMWMVLKKCKIFLLMKKILMAFMLSVTVVLVRLHLAMRF